MTSNWPMNKPKLKAIKVTLAPDAVHCDACVWTQGNPFGVRDLIRLGFCAHHLAALKAALP